MMNKENFNRTDFLFATPSFMIGAGSILNIAGNYFDFNYSPNAQEADSRALESDWAVVGNDLQAAFQEFETERKSQKNKMKTVAQEIEI